MRPINFTGCFPINISTLLWTNFVLGTVDPSPGVGIAAGGMVRSHFEQSVGLGDSCDCIYCPWPGQLCTCSHRDGEGKQEKKPKMHSIPIKGSVRAAPGWGEGVTGERWPFAVPSQFGRAAAPRLGWQHFKEDPPESRNHWQGSLTPPFCYLGWLTNAASYSKPKIRSWGSSRTRCQQSQSYIKLQKPSQGVAWLCCTWLLASWCGCGSEILGFKPSIVCLNSPLNAC